MAAASGTSEVRRSARTSRRSVFPGMRRRAMGAESVPPDLSLGRLALGPVLGRGGGFYGGLKVHVGDLPAPLLPPHHDLARTSAHVERNADPIGRQDLIPIALVR